MARLRTRPHPIAAVLGFLIFGPILAAAALLYCVAYLLAALLRLASRRRA